MLATGNSVVRPGGELAVRSVRVSAHLPEGIAAFHAQHPDIPIYTAAIDRTAQRQEPDVPGRAMPATACSALASSSVTCSRATPHPLIDQTPFRPTGGYTGDPR
jgi:hypothetical protein